MGIPEEPNTRVKTVETTLEIIDYLKSNQGSTLSEITQHVDRSVGTVHGHIKTLEQFSCVAQQDGEYYLGLYFLQLGSRARDRYLAYPIVKPAVDNLASETEERAQFVVEEHGLGVYLHTATGERAVRAGSGMGQRIFLHTTAVGKSILASFSDAEVERIIDHRGLEAETPNSIADSEELFDELDAVRERGYAINDEEEIEGLRGIGVPLEGKDGETIGAISVSGPTYRMQGERLHEELPDLLLGTANELELKLSHEQK